MKSIFATLLAFFGLGGSAMASEGPKEPAAMMRELRAMVLALTADAIGIDQKSYAHEVWGVLMETGTENAFYSLIVLADGTTSLYFSTGGGIIGAGEHAQVRQASKGFIELADDLIAIAEPVDAYPPPNTGQTIFYFLTFHGVKTYTAKEVDLGKIRDGWSNLFHAGHDVIAAIRQAKGD